ncbi:hypothetical protein F2P81_017195 [Scophthalmus maximus]|uniref:Uncharacterized protein n=1 Tax=Scophthalmus maximus TaxID=52904 RepID=A0A6A4SHQ5_SCOMX|nr:hypothetical protein F2P81_017195 [Scophthalmus maximus]
MKRCRVTRVTENERFVHRTCPTLLLPRQEESDAARGGCCLSPPDDSMASRGRRLQSPEQLAPPHTDTPVVTPWA